MAAAPPRAASPPAPTLPADSGEARHHGHHRHLHHHRARLPLWALPLCVLAGALALAGTVWLANTVVTGDAAVLAQATAARDAGGDSFHAVVDDPAGGDGVGGGADDAPADPPLLIPSSLAELQATGALLRAAVAAHPLVMVALFSVAYLFKQTFSFPGSALLNAAAGIAFGWVGGTTLACVCTAGGTLGAYLLSREFGEPLLAKLGAQARLAGMRAHVESARQRGALPVYLTAVRLATVFPQWLLNLAAPHIGIPIALFVPTTTLGLLPYNAITVHAGATLATVSDWSQLLSPRTVALLCGVAVLLVAPHAILRRLSPPPRHSSRLDRPLLAGAANDDDA